MMKPFAALAAAIIFTLSLPAQHKVYHFLYANYSASLNKQTYWVGYSLGYRRVTYNLSYGFGKGNDHQHLNPEDVGNNQKEGELSSSNVIDLSPKPPDSYLEDVNSEYSGPMVRLGITCFLRRNDTLGRHPFTGPHAGLEANAMYVSEKQVVTYKANSTEDRWMFEQGRYFRALGAATHIGWQFAFLHDRLYVDARFVIPFLYPFIEEPNVNSPFAGTKYEGMICLAWHIGWGSSDPKPEDTDAPKVRDKL